MATIYGYDIKPTHDRFVDLAEDAVKKLSDSVFPGAFAVNTFPFLRHLPSWFPGCSFHQYAKGIGASICAYSTSYLTLVSLRYI
jgi:hypothetical protein